MSDLIRRKVFLRLLSAFLVTIVLLLAIKHYEALSLMVATSDSCQVAASQSGPAELKNETRKPYHIYEDEVDLRIIVIAYDRAKSLSKLLLTVDELETDGDKAAMEIWLDVNKQGQAHNETLAVARAFKWKQGTTRVHVQHSNVGIYGQWIDTWRPKSPETKEVGLILEDDLSISKYSYRWIKAVHKFYGGRNDFNGVTIQSDEVKAHDGSSRNLLAPKNETAFLYKCIGTWGFSPKASVWMGFQDWYHANIGKPGFDPLVPGILPSQWYKNLKSHGRANSMWEMWFIYYAYKEKLYTAYSNLNTFNADGNSCLCINRREVGLHYAAKGPENYCKLLNRWDDKFVNFSNNITILNWNGIATKEY